MTRLIEGLRDQLLRCGERVSIPVEAKFVHAVVNHQGVANLLSQPGIDVLEIGLDPGLIVAEFFTTHFPKINLRIVEKKPDLIKQVSQLAYFQQHPENLITAEFPKIEIPQQNLIVGKHIFPFINPQQFGFEVMTRLLKPGGRAFASENPYSAWATKLALKRAMVPYTPVKWSGKGTLFLFTRSGTYSS